jgi:hypothetical protein
MRMILMQMMTAHLDLSQNAAVYQQLGKLRGKAV